MAKDKSIRNGEMRMANRIEMRGVSKSFPGVKALDGVSLNAKPGEVLTIVGENGAGKSTLMKILSGVYQRDEGEIFFDGNPVEIKNIDDSAKLGIHMIFQELNLIPHLDIAENIFLGVEPRTKLGLVDYKKMHKISREYISNMGLNISTKIQVKDLTVAQQQMVEITKAISKNATCIVMDEPTAAITDRESQELFKHIKRLTSEGITILYISHRLEEVLDLSDRIFVMRDGKSVGELIDEEKNRDNIIKLMVGRDIGDLYPKVAANIGDVMLEAKNISMPGVLHDISFDVKAGEVLGFSGLMGAGRTELMRAIFKADKGATGQVFIEGNEVKLKNPKDAVNAGLAFVTEDRKRTGLILRFPVDKNVTLASLDKYKKAGLLNRGMERDVAKSYVEKFAIKTPSTDTIISTLSGGNQQKVVLSRWLCTDAKIIILDEPTRGIDVGAKREIYLLINELAAMGKAVIMISSDLPEVLGMSDRVAVISEGYLTGILPREEADQVSVMELAIKNTKL